MQKFLQFLAKRIVHLRYQITVHGAEHLPHSGEQALLLPNHVALVDPVIIYAYFSPQIPFKTLATNNYAEKKLLKPLFKAIGTVGVDDLNKSRDSGQVKNSLSQILQLIQQGESILLYPSGGLAGQGYEVIGAKKSAFLAAQELFQKNKNGKILAIQTKGLWGSIWSNAWSAEGANFGKGIWMAIGYLLANLLFFLPKRKVNIKIQDLSKELSVAKEAKDFNQILENYYNQEGEEMVSYLPHYFYYNDVKHKTLPAVTQNSITELQKKNSYEAEALDPTMTSEIIQIIHQIREDSKEHQITINSHLILELMLDSLDMAELKALVQHRYPQAGDLPILEIKTLGDLVAMAMGKLGINTSSLPACERNLSEDDAIINDRNLDTSKSILQHFKKMIKQDKNQTFNYDVLFGLQTRKDFLIKSYLLRNKVKHLEEEYVGIMLPSLSSTGLVLMGVYLANKTPVMMNWTLPQQAFDHCVKTSNVKVILTSKKFYDMLGIEWLANYQFIFLEDLLKNLKLSEKLKALANSISFSIPRQDPDQTAVILFTSGSESLPKAVALSHKNIISDIKGALHYISLTREEILFGFLPPFHSFGFSVNTILPMITGLRLVNTPDPNDTLTTGKLIAHTQASILTTTPTFLRNILQANDPQQLQSLKIIISGAEKCPEELFKRIKKELPNATLIEGYGITECSPVISLNPSKKTKAGSVGIAIQGGKLKIADLEHHKELKIGQEGMIYYQGENVFGGYLDPKLESPFETFDGGKWYKTGDLGYLDKDGYLYITGRLKRFIKIGGEMISLPMIEETLIKHYGREGENTLAIEAIEYEGTAKIVLFAVETPLTIKEVNSYLKSKGVGNLIRINEIREIGAIPILGTGKTDYKVLKGMI